MASTELIQAHAEVLRRVDPSGRLARIYAGEVTIGFYKDPWDQPPKFSVFPPAFVAIRGSSTASIGAWVTPFSRPVLRLIDYSVEYMRGDVSVICTKPEDFVRFIAITEWESRRPDAEVASFLEKLDVDLDLTQVAERNAAGLDPQESLQALGGPTASMPEAVLEPMTAFRAAIDARDFTSAWDALNSPGWTFAQSSQGLVVLQDLANDECVSLLAEAWKLSHTTWVEDGRVREWPPDEHVY